MAWSSNPSGQFSVSSFRKKLEEWTRSTSVYNLFWIDVRLKKVELFVWQAIHDRIMVNEVMHRFGCGNLGSTKCQMGNNGEETIDHLFLHCS
ncbi:hypothetical protein Dsin_015010 [Dipteronia sinensis]|uniref:Reverse transcriptase zinc-binding domain-containing protein n=1 Tax=Dipteronia sinensis TaxID=43782 RepID=A0AAE0ANY8_9ROSI|nr:hypothetical protein Dsin_015010 [Dipteronia sinensis]